MTCPELFSEIADNITRVVGTPYSEKPLTIEQLENIADLLTVYMAGVLHREGRNKSE
jgi:hypothetical protein